MFKWIVDVSRTGFARREVEVEAETREEAEDKAINMAGSLVFSEQSSEYEVISSCSVPQKGDES
jgi:hypothetical protein